MIRAVMYGARDLRLEESELEPTYLRDDEVYVKTEVTALSTGTDLGNYSGRSTEVPGAPPYPRAVGYSNVGVIRAAGEHVHDLHAGQRVFSLQPHQSAFIAKASSLLVPVPEGVSSEQASLAYLTQLGVAAVRQAHYEAGESVAVVGLGVIGLATAGVLRAMGATVIGIANSAARADAALRAGAHRAFLAEEAGIPGNQDIVVLTANPWSAFRLSVDLARRGGRISILGFPGRGEPPPAFNPLDPSWFYGKQLTLIGAGLSPRAECPPADIRFNLRRNLEYILELMKTGALRLEPIISHRIPATKMQDAYELARTHSKDLTAAVFDWRGL